MKKPVHLYLLLFVLTVVLFLLDRQNAAGIIREGADRMFSPVRHAAMALNRAAGRLTASLSLLGNGPARLRYLESRNLELEGRVARQSRENHELEQLKLACRTGDLKRDARALFANVIAVDRYLVLDRGGADGVYLGATVYYLDYYVGKIVRFNRYTSFVILPTDPDSRVAAISLSGRRSVIMGRFGNTAEITGITRSEPTAPDEEIFTSGEGDILPGLVIGKTGPEISKEHEPFLKSAVRLPLDFKQLENVLVTR